MKSLCIKTNYLPVIDYLLKSFESIPLENTFVTVHRFKHFQNLILHHKGKEHTLFLNNLANNLTKSIITYYEQELIAKQLRFNYFYFHSYENKQIMENVFALLADKKLALQRYHLIDKAILKKISNSHSFYLQAFIDFCLTDYIAFLNHQIEVAVNQYLINKEYLEFVDILKLYIQSESCHSQTEHVHLIYQNKTSILVDDDKNIISHDDNLKKVKYISDISFSSNDYALNTLLNLVPKSITIHLVDHYCDEFINTLKLIFQDHIQICEDCDICHVYKRKELKQ